MNSEKPEVSQGPGTPLVRKRTLGGRLRGYLLAGVLVTAPLGVKLAHFLTPRQLKLAFAVFLFATSARMFSSLL